MPYKFNLGGKTLSMDDLTIDEVQAIASKHGVGFADVYFAAGQNAGVLRDLLTVAAAKLGVDPPPMARNSDIARLLRADNDTFVFVKEDDLPDNWQDGNPQTADATTTPT